MPNLLSRTEARNLCALNQRMPLRRPYVIGEICTNRKGQHWARTKALNGEIRMVSEMYVEMGAAERTIADLILTGARVKVVYRDASGRAYKMKLNG